MRISHWAPAQLELRWSDLAPLVKKIADASHGEMNALDLYNLVMTGFYHVAVVDDGLDLVAMICYRVAIRPQFRVLVMEQAGGSRLDEWMDMNAVYAAELQRNCECDRLELVGRPGWARALRRKYPDRVLEKSVTLILEAPDGRRT